MTKDVVVASEQLDIEKLVAAIREIAGEHLDRVILYGSYAWGVWDAERSDIDVAVLLRYSAKEEGVIDMFLRTAEERKQMISINVSIQTLKHDKSLGSLASRLAFAVKEAESTEQLRLFAPCMEAKMLARGKVLWFSPEPRQYCALPVEEARKIVVERGMGAATRIIDSARYELAIHEISKQQMADRDDLDGYEWSNNCADSHTAACMCLRAMLYDHDVDPSNNAMRWRVAQLLAGLVAVMPQASTLLPCVAYLPDYFRNEGDLDSTSHEARNAIAAAMRIHRFTCKTTARDCLRSAKETNDKARRVAGLFDEERKAP